MTAGEVMVVRSSSSVSPGERRRMDYVKPKQLQSATRGGILRLYRSSVGYILLPVECGDPQVE